MLAKLQRYFVHGPCKESSYFKLFGPVYTQSYHGSPQAPQLCIFPYPGCIFPGPDLSPISLGQELVGSPGMRFWGGCGLQTDLCGSSLDASKSRWSNGIPAVNSKNIFLR